MSLVFIFPLIILGLASILGLMLVGLAKAKSDTPDEGHFTAILIVAAGIPVLAAVAVLVSQSGHYQELYGKFIDLLWLWALGAFVVGCVVGWASIGQEAKK